VQQPCVVALVEIVLQRTALSRQQRAADVWFVWRNSLQGKRCLVSGSGNVAQYAAEKLLQLGATVLTMSDSTGYVYEPNGFTMEQVQQVRAWADDCTHLPRLFCLIFHYYQLHDKFFHCLPTSTTYGSCLGCHQEWCKVAKPSKVPPQC
jgi:hypothetical protein